MRATFFFGGATLALAFAWAACGTDSTSDTTAAGRGGATGGGNGNNCHIDVAGGFLYAGSDDGVKRFPWAPDRTSGGAGEDVVVGQPPGGHGLHTTHVYDGYLYVHSGSAGNMTNGMSPSYDT